MGLLYSLVRSFTRGDRGGDGVVSFAKDINFILLILIGMLVLTPATAFLVAVVFLYIIRGGMAEAFNASYTQFFFAMLLLYLFFVTTLASVAFTVVGIKKKPDLKDVRFTFNGSTEERDVIVGDYLALSPNLQSKEEIVDLPVEGEIVAEDVIEEEPIKNKERKSSSEATTKYTIR